jgi:hypothetical protein
VDAVASESGKKTGLVADAQSAVQKLVYEDGAANVMTSFLGPWQLKGDGVEEDGAVVANHPVVLDGEQQA